MNHRPLRRLFKSIVIPLVLVLGLSAATLRSAQAQQRALPALPGEKADGPQFKGILYVDAVGAPYRDSIRVTQLVDELDRTPFNTFMIQALSYGDAYFHSRFLPPAYGVNASSDPAVNFDPIASFTKSVKSGPQEREVWAWVDPLLVGNSNRAVPRADSHVISQHSEWLSRNIDFKTTDLRGNMYLEPGLEAVQRYAEAIVEELATQYPQLDGIVIRGAQYPGLEGRWGYHPGVLKMYREAMKLEPNADAPNPDDPKWSAVRRDIITEMVDRMSAAAKKGNPNIKVGVVGLAAGLAPGSADDFDETQAYTGAMQDWPKWMEGGIVDFVIVDNFQNEGEGAEVFDAWNYFAAQQQKSTGVDTHVAVAGFDNISIDLLQQIQRVAEVGLAGVALAFYSDPLQDSSSKELFYRALANNVLARDARRKQVDDLARPTEGVLVAGASPAPQPTRQPVRIVTPTTTPIESTAPITTPAPLITPEPAQGYTNLIEPDPDALEYLRKTFRNIF